MTKVAPARSLLVFYLLLLGVGGILAHLASEFAGMGADATSLVFSPRHWYLALSAALGAYVFIVRGLDLLHSSPSHCDLKRVLRIGLAALPFGGKGVRFWVLTAGLQFAIGSLTAIGEGSPFWSNDAVPALLGALVTVLVLALVARAIGHRLPSIVAAVARYLPLQSAQQPTTYLAARRARLAGSLDVWFPLLFNRPPPSLQFPNAI